MEVTILPSILEGTVTAPPSKSCMHRALICAALSERPVKIYCTSFSKDVEATMDCLKALGADFEYFDSFVKVIPIDLTKECNEECVLDCRESGSTLRFMLPVSAALGRKCKFIGAKRLGERPLGPLCRALESHGIKIEYKDSFLPCTISGKLQGGEYEIDGNISSQFITGLLLALGISGGKIKIKGKLQSKPYIDITTDIQKRFGVVARKTDDGYSLGQGGYSSPEEFWVEGDYSNAAFWLCAGAIGGKITCENLSENSPQGDKKIVDILKTMGAHITRDKDSVTVDRSELFGTKIDAADIPDIVPVLCVLVSGAKGRTVFYNTERLRDKESDRVEQTVNMISSLGGKIWADQNTITVEGSTLTGGKFSSANDHRIAMSGAIASIMCKDRVIISGAEAVSKSYPDFYEKFKELGGEVL